MIFTELTFAILKYSFLALLWVFVWLAIRSLRLDIEVFSPRKKTTSKKSWRRKAASVPQKQPQATTVSQQQEQPTLLVIIDGPLAGSSFPLSSDGVSLGRAPSNTVVLNDEFVSSNHARVYFDAHLHNWILEDLGSTNGTMLGHNRVTTPVVLMPRKPVRIGATMFELR